MKEDRRENDLYSSGRNPKIDKYSSDTENPSPEPVKGIRGGNHLLQAAQDKVFDSIIGSLEAIEAKLRNYAANSLYKDMPNADPSTMAKVISAGVADEILSLLDTEAKKNPMISAWNELVESCNGVCENCVIKYVCPSTQAEFVDFAEAGRVRK